MLSDRVGFLAAPVPRSRPHSHSIVPGGFDVMSYTTRLTAGTSFCMPPCASTPRSRLFDLAGLVVHPEDYLVEFDSRAIEVSALYDPGAHAIVEILIFALNGDEFTRDLAHTGKTRFV